MEHELFFFPSFVIYLIFNFQEVKNKDMNFGNCDDR